MFESNYPKIFENKLNSPLRKLGFVRMELKGCMKPEMLFRRGNLWLSSSWDLGDNYFEFDLGQLYNVRDVMTHFIVLGNYNLYCPEVDELDITNSEYVEKYLDLVVDTLHTSIVKFDSDYENIKSAQLSRFSDLDFLGEKVSRREWSRHKT